MKNYISSQPNILGGTAVIAGTRIPVSRILYLLQDGYTVGTILQDYPSLNAKIVKKTIDEAADVFNGGYPHATFLQT